MWFDYAPMISPAATQIRGTSVDAQCGAIATCILVSGSYLRIYIMHGLSILSPTDMRSVIFVFFIRGVATSYVLSCN